MVWDINSMNDLIGETVNKILSQLEDKNWSYPIYQLTPSLNDGLYFGRYNSDGTFDSLVEQETLGVIGYPVTLVLIDARGETLRGS